MACWVVPGASRTEIKGLHGDALRVRVSAPPEGGRANELVCRVIESAFGGKAEIKSGATGRRKQVLVRGVSIAAARQAASGWV